MVPSLGALQTPKLQSGQHTSLLRVGQRFAAMVLRQARANAGAAQRGSAGNYLRDAASTYWHQTCTAEMGRAARKSPPSSATPLPLPRPTSWLA
jgi:hypothetical protein